ncbi:DUF1559 domain-containing protein [Tautonia sp. JC769]|uniref:DUF1559 family PulG-like putative transporter n=1 Tax=Tautonia sp. JC769 TaxID=3232135 RepID=UPI00345AC472
MKRWIAWGVALILLFLALALMGLVVPLDAVIALTMGWVFFLNRVVPEVTIARDGVITGLLCLIGFVVGAHALLAWFARQRGAGDTGESRPWPVRWTAAMTGTLLVMFVAGIAATGIVHQVGWLLTSREPVVTGLVSLAARRAQSTNNLKQIGIGLDNYHRSQGSFPPGGTFDDRGRPLHGWQAMLLPFVDHQALYDRIVFERPWDDPANREPFRTEVLMFLNPGNENRRDAAGYALGHYSGNARLLGGEVPRSLEDVTDGSSGTILAGEVGTGFLPWGSPAQWRDPALGINRSARGFGGPFPGGANFLFADGSVRFVKETVDDRVLETLSTPSGHEPIPHDSY